MPDASHRLLMTVLHFHSRRCGIKQISLASVVRPKGWGADRRGTLAAPMNRLPRALPQGGLDVAAAPLRDTDRSLEARQYGTSHCMARNTAASESAVRYLAAVRRSCSSFH